MTVCYRCGREPFPKKHEEEIDGEMRTVCGRCVDIVCAICGKTKFKDLITKWTYSMDEVEKKLVPIGDCCVYVSGKSDILKMGIKEYKHLKQSNPEKFKKLSKESEQRKRQRQQFLGQANVAESLIDGWAAQKRNKKITTDS